MGTGKSLARLVTKAQPIRSVFLPFWLKTLWSYRRERKTTTRTGSKRTGRAAAKAAANVVLDKYLLALGGEAALQKIKTRVAEGIAELGRGRQFPINIYSKGPDKRISVMHLPNGDSITAFDGTAGWLSNPGHPIRLMNRSETDAARLDANLYLAAQLRNIFEDFRSAAPETIGGHNVNVVLGRRKEQPTMKFYFDQQSGLLVRILRYAETPLGLNPMQIDFADYRDANGIKTPFRWTIARPAGKFTVQMDQMQQNIPVDDSKFQQPAPNAP